MQDPVAAAPRRAGRSAVRAIIIAAPLLVVDAFWVIRAERVALGPYFTCISLFANVLFLLTALIGINTVLRRFKPRWMLTAQELLLVYTMLAIGSAIAGQDFLSALPQMMGHVTWFADGSNGWEKHFGAFLPGHLLVSDKAALTGFYNGHSTLYTPEHLRAWAGPVCWWTFFVVVLLWCMMCLNVLLRQRWQDHERLTFPIVAIPMQMTNPSGALWKSRIFWLGFALSASIEVLNGLSYLYPSLPSISIKAINVQNQGVFSTHPWNAVGYTCYSFYPFVIGLGYLLPLDLTFSCWFFYFFWKAQLVFSAARGWDAVPDFPFLREQSFGGYMAVLLVMCWNGRHYFRHMGLYIVGRASNIGDQREALTYRQAALGLLCGFAFLVLFMMRAGLSLPVAIIAFLIYFAISLAITRMRAEMGPPVHDLHFSGPDYILTHTFGTAIFGPQQLTALTFFYWFNRAYRCHPMPVGIEGLRAASEERSAQRAMFWSVMVAVVIGTLSAFWVYLYLGYSLGTQAGFSQKSGFAPEAFDRLNTWTQTPQPANGMAGAALIIGLVFCCFLLFAKTELPWWPFHPFGYAISSSWAMNNVWLPLLLAWAIKGLILRYGGVRVYRLAMPFFIGLILGEMVVGTAWYHVGLAAGIQPYSFWTG